MIATNRLASWFQRPRPERPHRAPKGRVSAFLGAREGATAVEFAIVITPLLLLLLGTIEFGRLLWTREALRETAMTAARCMGVLQKPCQANGSFKWQDQTKSYIESRALGWSVVVQDSEVTLNNSATCANTPGFSQVTINYTFVTAVPALLGSLKGVPLTVSACFPNQSQS